MDALCPAHHAMRSLGCGATFSWALHALANRQRVGRRKAWPRQVPLALLATRPWPLPLSQVQLFLRRHLRAAELPSNTCQATFARAPSWMLEKGVRDQ